MPTPRKAIRYDAFVEGVRPDPKSVEEVVDLQGYIGRSDLEGHVRVYSDSALNDFIELPEADILYHEPISTEEDPLGGSRLWVRKSTVFTTGDPNLSNRVKSSFLEGDIVRAFGDVTNAPAAVLPIVAPTFITICQTTTSRPRSCCVTKVGVPCNWPTRIPRLCPSKFPPVCTWPSQLQPTCPTRPTCFKSCGVVCTALPVCDITVPVVCPQTVVAPCKSQVSPCATMAGTACLTQFCPSNPECPTMVCPSNPACPTFGCPTDFVIAQQQAAAQQMAAFGGYEGGFNPYMTSVY